MPFQVLELSIELIETLQPVVVRIKAKDRSLADQLQRAASSVALNLGESRLSDPGNRRARLHTAAGSAHEVLTALRVAVAWRHVTTEQTRAALGLSRRVVAILWKLTRG